MQINKSNFLSLAFIFVVITFTILCRFYDFQPQVFYGDDLSSIIAYLDGRAFTIKTFLLAGGEKYRPVTNLIFMLEANVFAYKIVWYQLFNIFIYSSCSLILFLLLKEITNNFITSLVLTLVMASSRFAGYIVSHAIGPIEGVALLMMLAIVYFLYSSEKKPSNALKYGYLSLILLFLIIHTHERYIALSLWMFVVFAITSPFKGLSRLHQVALLLATILVPFISLLIKVFVVKIPILVGTGGAHIAIDPFQILSHFNQGALSIIGFNSGPDYLVGASIGTLNFYPYQTLAILNFLSIVFVSILVFLSKEKKSYIWPCLFIFLAFLILLSASITIRMEQRWILSSYVLLLITFGWFFSILYVGRKFLAYFLLFIFCFSAISLDSLLMKFFYRVYYVYSYKFAEIVKRDVTDKYSFSNDSKIYFVARKEFCQWVLRDGNFFRIYNHNVQKTECIDESEIKQIPINESVYIFKSSKDGSLMRVIN
jgi:hypothetical protein